MAPSGSRGGVFTLDAWGNGEANDPHAPSAVEGLVILSGQQRPNHPCEIRSAHAGGRPGPAQEGQGENKEGFLNKWLPDFLGIFLGGEVRYAAE